MVKVEVELEQTQAKVVELAALVADVAEFSQLSKAEQYLVKEQLSCLYRYKDIIEARCSLAGGN